MPQRQSVMSRSTLGQLLHYISNPDSLLEQREVVEQISLFDELEETAD